MQTILSNKVTVTKAIETRKFRKFDWIKIIKQVNNALDSLNIY